MRCISHLFVLVMVFMFVCTVVSAAAENATATVVKKLPLISNKTKINTIPAASLQTAKIIKTDVNSTNVEPIKIMPSSPERPLSRNRVSNIINNLFVFVRSVFR